MDVKREGLSNQKRSVSVGVYAPTETAINADAIVGTLPERAVITNVRVVVKSPSTTGAARINVRVGTTALASNVPVTATGVQTVAVPASSAYFPTGGDFIVTDGSTAPAAGDLEVDVVVEYIELDLVTGAYTA